MVVEKMVVDRVAGGASPPLVAPNSRLGEIMVYCQSCDSKVEHSLFSPSELQRKTPRCRPCLRIKDGQRDRSAQQRTYLLEVKWNITEELYDKLLELQGGSCYLCDGPPPKGKRFAVDHDHRCCPTRFYSCGNCVRGLLCGLCNAALGRLETDGWASRAHSYLQENPMKILKQMLDQ